ncbi:MAG: right-handed parallel beta-helix repeat-containing protein [candidate division WOR-3 bacterium]|nr:MAG: right-handed parallel beta-helix repeat-containing protein [candidate division WOR-3 bacterium]
MGRHCIMWISIVGMLLSVSNSFAYRTIWYVHPDSTMNSIQAGIDSCSTGDIVLVAPGTYFENINFGGKAITVTSELGPGSTIIDGSTPAHPDTGCVVIFISGEDTNSVLHGFTITNGTGLVIPPYGSAGGGISCYTNSSPTITGNIITENAAVYGGGIDLFIDCAAIIIGNTISGNISDSSAGGIVVHDNCSPIISDNIITENTGYDGGGINCGDTSSATISNNTISNNNSRWGGGIVSNWSSPLITDNTITDNTSIYAGGIDCYGNPSPTIINNIITGNYALFGGGIDCENDASPIITGNAIDSNTAAYGAGIRCWNNSDPSINECSISRNIGDGVYIGQISGPVLHYNNIVSNTGHGVRNLYPLIIVDAENNWWGDATGPYHPDSNPGGLGDQVSNFVDFTPWLTEPGIEEKGPSANMIIALQIIPNPFRHFTDIRYQMTEDCGDIVLNVYDITGRKVKTLLKQQSVTGYWSSVRWDGRDQHNRQLSSGVYFLHFQAGDYITTEKILLIR